MTVLGCLSHPEIPFPVAVLGREFRRGWLETRLRMVRVAWMGKIMSTTNAAGRHSARSSRPSHSHQSIPWRTCAARPERRTREHVAGADKGGTGAPKLVLNCELQVISVAGAEADPRLPFRSIPRLVLEGFALTAR